MARGDQVYSLREIVGVPYEHHGIDCGDGTIIHYSKDGEAEIARTPRSVFARGSAVYPLSVSTSFIPDIVIERAESRLGERQYDLFFNNCEHFADWCKTGRGECAQLNNFGLRMGQIKLPEVGELANSAARNESPERTQRLLQEALGNIAIATDTLLPQYEKVMQDVLTWDRVAKHALTKDREDLARAALYKKVTAKKEATEIKTKLNQLSDLQLNLEQNKTLVESRMG